MKSALFNEWEWNVKISEYTSKDVVNSFRKTFETYWNDKEFKTFIPSDEGNKKELKKSLSINEWDDNRYVFFELKPYSHQKEILEDLRVEREEYRSYKNLVVEATGSGKTLTSFKAAILATEIPAIDKVIFVVDRKDLDYQTMREYDRFEKGAANGNSSTRVLQGQLENKNQHGGYENYKIIVTTIQKLDVFIKKNKKHDIYNKHVVLIFDECHRSQFGGMHRAIIKNFRNYHVFGFTGTPIFAANAPSGGNPTFSTTEQVFGEKLHTYTIVDAINDGNVLPFRIDFINTIKTPTHIEDEKVYTIDRERALAAPERISEVVAYILDHFDQKTKRQSYYSFTAKWEEKEKDTKNKNSKT